MPETIIIWFSNYFIDILTTQSLILIDSGTYAVTADSHHFTIPQITWSFGHFSMPTQCWTIYATHTADFQSLTRLRISVIGCINTKWCFTSPIRKNIDRKKNKDLSWDISNLYCFVKVIEVLLPQGAREVKPYS